MKISAVYIAKNEAKNIACSLESIKDVVDELILVDTGSTDNTVEIFKSYKGQVYYQPWADDFSSPRNLALSKSTGDWIIILDADESFSLMTGKNIKPVLTEAAADTNGILINMINYDKDTGEALDEFYALRIVRNIPGLNYKGRIHEMMYIGDDHFYGLQRVGKNLLTIEHTGYTASISVKKNQRNVRLMEAAIADGEPAERYYTSLYESYSALGDMRKALYYAELDVARGRQLVTYASRSYRGLISYYAKDTTSVGRKKYLELVQQAVKDFPELPDFHAEYSECLYHLGRYSEAKREIELAISLYNSYDGLEPCLLTEEMKPIMEQRRQVISRLADQQRKFTISACVIVKNEEENIYNWLQNVSAFADEIIINDTGSEDSTKEMISRFSEENPDMPIVLLESMWQDDFSFAKNQCLAEATGEWIVFTDADELFVTPEMVREIIAEYAKADSQLIMVPMNNVDKDDNNTIINRVTVPRVFRRADGLCYEGRIHEMITIDGCGPDAMSILWADNRLLMNHTGYSSGINRKKAQRNLELLLKDIEAGQDIKKLYGYLAESYYELGDYEKALNNALLATQSDYRPMGQQGDMYWLALNAMEDLHYSIDDRLILANIGIKLFSNIPDFYIRRGILLFEERKYHEAVRLFADAEELIANYNSDIQQVSSNFMSLLHVFYTVWGRCLYKKGYSCAAEEKYKNALNINPWYDRALCYWADIYQGRLDETFLSNLATIYDALPNSRIILESIFVTNGFPELAAYLSDGSQSYLVKEKSYTDMYNKSTREMANLISTLAVCLLEAYNEQYVNLLPENLQSLINYFHKKKNVENVEDCFDTYLTILQEVMLSATEETVTKFLEISDIFSKTAEEKKEHIIKVADKLMKINEYKLALDFYQQISDKNSKVNGDLWQKMGICYYGLGQYQKAMENLQRGTSDKKTDTYKVWCQEAMKNGN